MSWLVFLDESGHDHQSMPYEVYGGIALHAASLWPFITEIRTLEESLFGTFLEDFGSEIKGAKLVGKNTLRWARQGPPMDNASLRKHALNFLTSSSQHKAPRRHEFTAFGQACISFATGILERLVLSNAKVFAAFTPPIPRPPHASSEMPRRDMMMLLERFYHFLRDEDETGLLVLDRTDKSNDKALAKRLESYFQMTGEWRTRVGHVVPAPLFVESDMAYGVQVADLCIYILNWGFRTPVLAAPSRDDFSEFIAVLEATIWSQPQRQGDAQSAARSVFYVSEPYSEHRPTLWERNKEGGKSFGTTGAVPRLSLHY